MKLMKISLASFLSVLLVLLAVIACQEQDVQDFKSLSEEANLKSSTTNPYNYVGVYHNSSLTAIGAPSGSFSFTDAANSSRIHILSVNPTATTSTSIVTQIAQKVDNLNGLENCLEVINNLYNNAEIDLEARNAYIEIYDAVMSAEQGNFNTIEEGFDFVTNMLVKLEQTFLARTFTFSTNREIALSSIATAIKSTDYWRDAYSNPNNPFHNTVLGWNTEKRGGFWKIFGKILSVVVGDAVGAVIGLEVSGGNAWEGL